MRNSTWGQLDGTAAMGAIPEKSRMRSAPGSPIPGNFLSVARDSARENFPRAARRLPPYSSRIFRAIPFARAALSSGTIPPARSARAILEGVADSTSSGAAPTSRSRASHPLLQRSSLGGYPHCHHTRSEEHTSELQSRRDLVCRLLLEKKKKIISKQIITSKKKEIKNKK